MVFIFCVVLFTALAAASDLRSKKIPNTLTVSAAVAGLIFQIIKGAIEGGGYGALTGVGISLGGFATGFGILLVLWLMGGGGGGDVKLMAALGAWLGAPTLIIVFMISTLFVIMSAVAALTYQLATKGFSRTSKRYVKAAKKTKHAGTRELNEEEKQTAKVRRRLVPYGVPVALATWIVLAINAFKG